MTAALLNLRRSSARAIHGAAAARSSLTKLQRSLRSVVVAVAVAATTWVVVNPLTVAGVVYDSGFALPVGLLTVIVLLCMLEDACRLPALCLLLAPRKAAAERASTVAGVRAARADRAALLPTSVSVPRSNEPQERLEVRAH